MDWRDDLYAGQDVLLWQPVAGKKKPSKTGKGGQWVKAHIEGIDDGTLSVTVAIESGFPTGFTTTVLPRDSPDLQPAMRHRGMTMAQLRRFAADCRAECSKGHVLDPREFLDPEGTMKNPGHNLPLDFESAPAWLVVDLFVKPATRGRRVPFVDVMAERWPDLGGPKTATHFSSHSWGQVFADDVAAFEHLGDQAAVWVCCFALTQDEERLEHLDSYEVFVGALAADTTQAHVLALDEQFQALGRMWVLFEILRAHESGKPIRVVPPDILTKSGLVDVEIELSQATCTSADDEHYIREAIQREGFETVNAKVREAVLRALHTQCARIERQRGVGHLDVAVSCRNMARFFNTQRQYAEAEEQLRRALVIYASRFGEPHPKTTEVRSDLAGVLARLGRWRDAEMQLRRIQSVRTAVSSGTEAARDHLRLAGTLTEQGRHTEAEPELRKALTHLAGCIMCSPSAASSSSRPSSPHGSHRTSSTTAGEPGTDDVWELQAAVHRSLGHCLRAQGRPAEAEVEIRAALSSERQRTSKGSRAQAAADRANLGAVLAELGQYTRAEAEYRGALCIHLERLGSGHFETETCRGELGWVLLEQGRSQEAADGLRAAAAVGDVHFGKDHPSAAARHVRLGVALQETGRPADAEAELSTAIDHLQAHRGQESPMAVPAKSGRGKLARALLEQDSRAEAEAELRSSLPSGVEVSLRRHARRAAAQEVIEIFRSNDSQGTGMIRREALKNVVRKLEPDADPEIFLQGWKDASVDYERFVMWVFSARAASNSDLCTEK